MSFLVCTDIPIHTLCVRLSLPCLLLSTHLHTLAALQIKAESESKFRGELSRVRALSARYPDPHPEAADGGWGGQARPPTAGGAWGGEGLGHWGTDAVANIHLSSQPQHASSGQGPGALAGWGRDGGATAVQGGTGAGGGREAGVPNPGQGYGGTGAGGGQGAKHPLPAGTPGPNASADGDLALFAGGLAALKGDMGTLRTAAEAVAEDREALAAHVLVRRLELS